MNKADYQMDLKRVLIVAAVVLLNLNKVRNDKIEIVKGS
jgi:hypothetical protein